ncbi:MAG: hypothetical protein E6663_16825, partial [Staphylococcus lugdunensis]|nr:hypothetical protein [Staphylococcus lugdunensis]
MIGCIKNTSLTFDLKLCKRTNVRIFKNIIQKQYINFNIEWFSHKKALGTSLRMYLGHENKLITYDCWTASTNASAARSPSLLEA